MKKFIKSVILFLIPVFIYYAITDLSFRFTGIYSGEFTSLEKQIEAQRDNHRILLGHAYNEQRAYYKKVNANYYKADIIAMGTSRVMQIKGEYFTTSFYNCGGCASGNYKEYKNFLENLTYKPKAIILGLDSWLFNENWVNRVGDYEEYVSIEKTERQQTAMVKQMRSDFLSKKWTFSDFDNYSINMGFNGKIKDSGFMYDGSYYYGYFYRYPEKHEDYQFVNTMHRIETSSGGFEWGEGVNELVLEQLDELLLYCYTNDIKVYGFLTPLAPTIFSTMEETGNYAYLQIIEAPIREIFDKYDYEFYNYNNGAVPGLTDDYFLDGFHGTEIALGYIMKDMLDKGSDLNNDIDLSRLSMLLDNAYSTKTFYNPDTRNEEY